MYKLNQERFLETFRDLLAIDSTTGQVREIQDFLVKTIEEMGYACTVTHKGGVICELGGEGNPLVVTAHADDIGLMVRHIRPDGTLRVEKVGGLRPYYALLEHVRIYTRDGRIYTGTVQRTISSVHVAPDDNWTKVPDYETNTVVVIDAPVKTAEDVRALGIQAGDMIALEPRFFFTNGYIKSRFIDDKAQVALCLEAMRVLKEENISLPRKVSMYFSMYEEIGHGTSFLPADTKDLLAVDIAVTGPDQATDEQKVTIFAKDARFPYHYEFTTELMECAKEAGVDYVMDVFTPHYGTDCNTSITAGYDIRHGAIGPGTSCSHGYERSHMDAMQNTYALMMAYMTR